MVSDLGGGALVLPDISVSPEAGREASVASRGDENDPSIRRQ
jgi:hypothetical protein